MAMSMTSCLSPGVYQLVCVEGLSCCLQYACDKCGVQTYKDNAAWDRTTCDKSSLYITEDGILDWVAIKSLVQDFKDMDNRASVKKLSSVYHSVKEHMEAFSVEEFTKHYRPFLEWTGNSEMCIRCFEVLTGSSKSSTLLSLLLSSAILERALGDVYLLKGKQCPSLLKDLLLTSELCESIGQFVVEFIRVLIGSPSSLNLRNLVWHGFPNPEEIHNQYAYVLIMVILSVGEILSSNEAPISIKHRSPVSLHKTETISQQFTEKFPWFSHEEFTRLCLESEFILPEFLPVWKEAFGLFRECRYGESVCLLFPLMENSLRLMFAQLNNCPHRVLTAQSSVLYTTFEEILAGQLPKGEENKLLTRIGRPLYDMLQDMMVMPEGPRFRDRLGHGEVKFEDVTEKQASAVWISAVGLVYKFISTSGKSPVLKNNDFVKFRQELEKYYTLFHPVSLLVNQILSLSCSVSSWLKGLHYTSELFKIEPGMNWSKLWADNSSYQSLQIHSVQIMSHFKSQLSGFLQHIDQDLFSPEHTLTSVISELPGCDRINFLRGFLTYSGQNNIVWTSGIPIEKDSCTMEAVTLLRKVIAECDQISENVVKALAIRQQQLEAKQLRSRQRDTLKRLIISVPCINVGVKAVILSSLSHLLIPHHPFTIRFLKSMLQYCENMRTYTSLDKNKWSESIELTKTFLQKLCEFLS